MKTLTTFWKKDALNKLIVLVSVGLVLGVLSLTILVLRLPAGRSLRGAVSELVSGSGRGSEPTPPINNATPTQRAAWTPQPTRTLTPSLSQATSQTPLTTEAAAIDTSLPGGTPAASPNPSITSDGNLGVACIPANAAQTGRVVEILDGNTVKVLIDDKVYVVRYLGVNAPDAENPFFAAATSKNSELVYGRDVSLTADAEDKDLSGRLLRYVRVGDTFMNLEMLSQGLGSAVATPPQYACAGAFAEAEKAAREAKRGQWSLLPAP